MCCGGELAERARELIRQRVPVVVVSTEPESCEGGAVPEGPVVAIVAAGVLASKEAVLGQASVGPGVCMREHGGGDVGVEPGVHGEAPGGAAPGGVHDRYGPGSFSPRLQVASATGHFSRVRPDVPLSVGPKPTGSIRWSFRLLSQAQFEEIHEGSLCCLYDHGVRKVGE